MIGVILWVACSPPRAPEDRRGVARIADENALAARALSAGERRTVDAVQFAILGSGNVRSFHLGYTALFHAHQPVYITADSLLHAWHSSHDAILFALERDSLAPMVERLLDGLRRALAGHGGSPRARADIDVVLAVAISLLHGTLEPAVAGGDPRAIADIVAHATSASGSELTLFGAPMSFDFSMLKPRGHYEEPELAGYFRAMSWLGRVELRIATRRKPSLPWIVDRRALDGVLLLAALFDAPTRRTWDAMDRALASLVGPRDSMSLPELATARAALPADLARASDGEIAAAFSGPARQRIRTQLVDAEVQSLSFVMLGQRRAFDAELLSNVVYDALPDEPHRMMPSPLDVAYGVFGNPAAKQLLAPEIAVHGAPYEAALEAARRDADATDSVLRTGSLYHRWLGALRALSPDRERDASLPAPLQSDAWSRRMLNTQLASWAELRHDNLLYAKPSVTARETCEYPDGYVDPYPAFYAAMEALAGEGKAMIAALPPEPPPDPRLAAFFDAMAATMARLHGIADRERADQPLEPADLDFLNHMVSLDGKTVGCTTVLEANGWYGDLFFDRERALEHEPVIVDVHTQPTDRTGIPIGRVLHVATAMPRMMEVTLAHDGGMHAHSYRGFVSTYSEVITDGFRRITDGEWRLDLAIRPPILPPWLGDIVAP